MASWSYQEAVAAQKSLEAAGVDFNVEGAAKAINMDLGSREKYKQESDSKAWKDVWSAGQGVGQIADIPKTSELVARLEEDYNDATKNPIL